MSKFVAACYDWRVIGGLAALSVGIWLYAPQLFVAALPFLFLLVCPLSMLIMSRMMDSRSTDMGRSEGSAADRLIALEREQARLSAEIARLDKTSDLLPRERNVSTAERSS